MVKNLNCKNFDIMDEVTKVISDDLRESAMKGDDKKIKAMLKEYIKEHPEHVFETTDEWVRNMTPEQRKVYYSMEDTKAFHLMYANLI